jgi:hypothetical protein
MIQRAVFSYFNPDESFSNKCGFTRFGDFLFTTALALLTAKRLFKETYMYSSDWGIDLFKKLDFPVTVYNNKLNELKNRSRYFWAYGKLLDYCDQEVPFVHIDNDVFLWEPLPQRILQANLCFQSHEPFNLAGYSYYKLLKKPWSEAPVRPQKIVDNEVKDFAYNCGICGGHNLDFFQEWRECSAEYIFAPENQEIFFKKHAKVLIHQNLFHEQYFAASLIKMHHLRKKVEVLDKDAMNISKHLKYTHLWGTTKRDLPIMKNVWMRLEKEDPALYKRINEFNMRNRL